MLVNRQKKASSKNISEIESMTLRFRLSHILIHRTLFLHLRKRGNPHCFSGTFRREGKVVDSLIGDTTRMPNFDMIQPLGEEPLTDAECPAMMARFRPLPRPCAAVSSRNQL